MTDRFAGVYVTFDHDIRKDDAQGLINAIGQLRGVIDVAPHVADFDMHIAQERVRLELRVKLLDVLKD